MVKKQPIGNYGSGLNILVDISDMKKTPKVAVIDLGTNTFHLLIAELLPGKEWHVLYKTKITVKLGEGGIHLGVIAPRPYVRGLKALRKFSTVIKKYKVEEVYAFATSGIRSTKNGSAFVRQVYQETGIKIRTIDGKKEAELICQGVLQTLGAIHKPVLIMDIGGGSTEFIITDQKKIYWKHSFDIGASRLKELFPLNDPIAKSKVVKLERYLFDILQPLKEALVQFPVTTLVGASGSFESFAKMIGYYKSGKNPIASRPTFDFIIKDYQHLHRKLISSALSDRYQMKGLVKMRADMIVPASIQVNLVLNEFQLKEMKLSTHALKEGVLAQLLQKY